MKRILLLAVGLFVGGLSEAGVTVERLEVEAPFPMENVCVPCFPERLFPITDYGAKKGGVELCTDAIARAIDACHRSGGGKVVVPAGTWLTGAVHLKSNVCLWLSDGATLTFPDDPKAFLPAVRTSWEGIECFNYSPLVYAFECENVGVGGPGTLAPKMDLWRNVWFKRPKPHLDALARLYHQMSTNAPVEARQMAVGENNLRPHLLQFFGCRNVRLEGFRIRESPFWTVHLYRCRSCLVRGLDVQALGHNNDGIDIEMTQDVLVERCTFDQGDDDICIKAGRNQDAWRLNTPSANIVVRDCIARHGGGFLVLGSELSGGIRNVLVRNITSDSNIFHVFHIKTNERRGGFVENIHIEDCRAADCRHVFAIHTDRLFQWKDLVPTYEKRYTRIRGLHMKNCHAKNAWYIVKIEGDEHAPVSDVHISDVSVDAVTKETHLLKNVHGLEATGIRCGGRSIRIPYVD